MAAGTRDGLHTSIIGPVQAAAAPPWPRSRDQFQLDALNTYAGTNTAGLLTLVSFGIPYAEFAGPFVTETLPLLSQQGPPEEVRLILSFDS